MYAAIRMTNLDKVAEVYLHEWQSGAPTKAVADVFGVSMRTASRWVSLARKDGLITTGRPPAQGRPLKPRCPHCGAIKR